MLTSKLELLVDFGPKPDESVLNNTLATLKKQDGIKEAIYKYGSILVETTLPSSVVVDMTSEASGKRTVLQGFGDTQHSAVAMVSSQSCCRKVIGVVRFFQSDDALVAEGTVDGLTGTHGLRVHECGDLSQGCKSIGDLFNPNKNNQDTLNGDGNRCAGDLGNIVADKNGRASFRLVDNVLKVWDIVGRSVAITERADDLSKGDNDETKSTESRSEPIACGIIARSAAILSNPKRVCACDGVVVWDERTEPLAGSRRGEGRCCRD